MSGEQYLYLTTTGWKSSQPHEIEIWFVTHEGCYYIVSELRYAAHWVQNIQRDPSVRFRVAERQYAGTARTVDPDLEPTLKDVISTLMDAKYGWSEGLVVELCPESSAAATTGA